MTEYEKDLIIQQQRDLIAIMQNPIMTVNPNLRDQFAMAALTGIVRGTPIASAQVAASCAYVFADAMLEARKEKK